MNKCPPRSGAAGEKIRRIPELLAPAGNIESALAAFDAGADAIYCGLGQFNARERAENFSLESLHRIIDFAHTGGKRVYITFNTLVFESELREALRAINELCHIAPDAFIVQDPGIMVMIKRFFPEMEVHFSTQAGIHNSAGVRAAAGFGATRVILERQLYLDEIRKIAADSPIELEVFIHGSLCCSLSGRCLFSEQLTGGSGNRGCCKQPCRMRYDNRYPFSPSDLSGTTVVEELRRLGIASFKIEGRLRPPEYIWKTARAYRMLLDAPPDEFDTALAEAGKLLRAATGRVSSSGFFFRKNLNTLINPDRQGSFGLPAARVDRRTAQGIEVTALNRMHLGDRLRPLSADGKEDGNTFSLISLESGGRNRLAVAAGSRCFLPGITSVPPGWMLIKIGENGFDYSRRAKQLPSGRFPVDFNLEIAPGGWRGSLDGVSQVEWQLHEKLQSAHNQAATAAKIEAEFRAGVPEPYKAGKIRISLHPGLFIPASGIKAARRAFWQWAQPYLAQQPPDNRAKEEFESFYHSFAGERSQFPPIEYKIPEFLAEADIAAEAANIRDAYRKGVRNFGVSGWHALELLKPYAGIRKILTFPFFVTNSLALSAAGDAVAAAETAPELPDTEVAALQSHTRLPVRKGGAVPLLVTRLQLADPGKRFKLKYRNGLTEVFLADPEPSSGKKYK